MAMLTDVPGVEAWWLGCTEGRPVLVGLPACVQPVLEPNLLLEA